METLVKEVEWQNAKPRCHDVLKCMQLVTSTAIFNDLAGMFVTSPHKFLGYIIQNISCRIKVSQKDRD